MEHALVVGKTSAYALLEPSQRDHAEAKRLLASHERQQRSLESVLESLQGAGIDATYSCREHFEPSMLKGKELVVTVGGDGTLLDVSHYIWGGELYGLPILGVNSDPKSSVGFFSIGDARHFKRIVGDLDHVPRTTLYRMAPIIDGQMSTPALNDILLANENPAATTRVRVWDLGEWTEYKGSGLIACTAAGSTGWMYQEGGEVMPIDPKLRMSRAGFQFHLRGIRDAPFEFSEDLLIEALTPSKLYIDGANIIYDVPRWSRIELLPAQPLTIMGDLAKKQRAYQ